MKNKYECGTESHAHRTQIAAINCAYRTTPSTKVDVFSRSCQSTIMFIQGIDISLISEFTKIVISSTMNHIRTFRNRIIEEYDLDGKDDPRLIGVIKFRLRMRQQEMKGIDDLLDSGWSRHGPPHSRRWGHSSLPDGFKLTTPDALIYNRKEDD